MSIWTLLGWLAFVLNVWGNLALTTKGVRGWVIRVGSNLAWIPYGVYTSAWALTANHTLFMAINFYGWWRWTRGAPQSFEARLCRALGWKETRPEEALATVQQMVTNASQFSR